MRLSTPTMPPLSRRVYCNRTLNLRGIRAIGCDMDYTLVHYNHDLWEQTAYEHVKRSLMEAGYPVQDFEFDPQLVTRGLVLDLERGNVVKCSRFGYVTRAMHGTRMLSHDQQRKAYARTLVDLSEGRWVFLNTLFSLSEGCLFGQLVDLLDAGALAPQLGYRDLYSLVTQHMGVAHMEGTLKEEIMRDPDRFVVLDEELPLALLDMKHAGKRLMVVTNSEWAYTRFMMAYAFDAYLPGGMTWRELFDVVIVSARKPLFFTGQSSLYEIVDEEAGLCRPSSGQLQSGKVFIGGHARLVEQHLGVPGEDILYVGDHLYADVHVCKEILRWRTALIVRELEEELAGQASFEADRERLEALMRQKADLERHQARLRLSLQRAEANYGPVVQGAGGRLGGGDHKAGLAEIKQRLFDLDDAITPLAARAARTFNPHWGPLMRAGRDKSRLARTLERYADVYTSRVSNFLPYTPYAYLRAPGGSLPHDG